SASGQLLLTAAEHFVFRDDDDRIEARIATCHRLFEKERAVQVVDAVVEMSRQWARIDDDLAAKSIAHLQSNLVAVDDERSMAQAVQPRGAVTIDLILHVALFRFGSEGRIPEALARIVAFQAGQRTAVTRKLCDGQSGLEVTEH